MATRGSPLARWQADHVAGLVGLAEPGVEVEVVVVETRGDADRTSTIARLGGQGVFTAEVQAAVLTGHADVAVHSAKDLPASAQLRPPGLVLAAFPERGDARDALVGGRLNELAPGAVVATGSPRRRVQLGDRRPDLCFTELRGNIATRLARADGGVAVVVAAAALERLGLSDVASEIFDPLVMLPQVGQGALAVECREDDDALLALLGEIDHLATRRQVEAERGFLAALGGGCDLPVAAHASGGDGASLRLRGMLAGPSGATVLRAEVEIAPTDNATALGHDLAAQFLQSGIANP